MTEPKKPTCGNCPRPPLANTTINWCGQEACRDRLMMNVMGYLFAKAKGNDAARLEMLQNQINRLLVTFKDVKHYANRLPMGTPDNLEIGSIRDLILKVVDRGAEEAGCKIPE